MKKVISELINLQDISKEIYELEKMINNVPPEVSQLREEYVNKKDRLKEMDTELDKREQKINILNSQIEEYKDKFSKSREKEKYISTQKEFEKLDEEQQFLNEHIKSCEKEITSIKKVMEEIKFHYLEIEDEVNEKEEKLNDIEGSLNEKKKTYIKKLEEKKKEKSQIVPNIDKAILSLYERIVQHKDGIGIVPVEDNICMGCYISIPSTVQNQLKKMDRIITCSNCARILYLPNAVIQKD